ncbi:MAG: alpha/beta fold hydrolase [Brachymonas sp.]
MANFVLVHGAWHGAWCWSRVLPLLRHGGHSAHAVTLTGVGERAHLLTREISLQTHITDVVNLIEAEELQEVVLVGHSYAGMVITGAADRLVSKQPDCLRHLVYLDASVPKPGEAWGDKHPEATRSARAAAASVHPLNALIPPDASVFGLQGADAAWVNRRQTPHPFGPYTDPVQFDVQRVAQVPRTFIDCVNPPLATIQASRERARSADTWNGHWLPKAQLVMMNTGHDPMVSAPVELADVLLRCAS